MTDESVISRTEKEVGGMEQAHDSVVWSLSWHPLGHILASGSNDHSCKFWTRNRPGDKMRDKYNLNLLPKGQEDNEYDDMETNAVIPGFGFEPGMGASRNMQLQTQTSVENDEIPGLGDEGPEPMPRNNNNQMRKIPFAKPVPQHFVDHWTERVPENQNEEMMIRGPPGDSDLRYSNNANSVQFNNGPNGPQGFNPRMMMFDDPRRNMQWSRNNQSSQESNQRQFTFGDQDNQRFPYPPNNNNFQR